MPHLSRRLEKVFQSRSLVSLNHAIQEGDQPRRTVLLSCIIRRKTGYSKTRFPRHIKEVLDEFKDVMQDTLPKQLLLVGRLIIKMT